MSRRQPRVARRKKFDEEEYNDEDEEFNFQSDDEAIDEEEDDTGSAEQQEEDEKPSRRKQQSGKKQTESRKRKTTSSKKQTATAPETKKRRVRFKDEEETNLVEMPDLLKFKVTSSKTQETSSTKKAAPRNVHKNLKQILNLEDYGSLPPMIPTYVNIEAPCSLHPRGKYCVVTGFHAKYKHPLNKLRYHSSAIYPIVNSAKESRVQQYLELTNQQSRI